MAKRALIVWGGWNGHEPEKVAGVFNRILSEAGFETEMSDTLDAFKDERKLKQLRPHRPRLDDGQNHERTDLSIARCRAERGWHRGLSWRDGR